MSIEIATKEDFDRLSERFNEIECLLLNAEVYLPMVVTIADIAKAERVSISQIRGKELYLLPNFGKSEFPEGKIRWNRSTYLAWRKMPVQQRYKAYGEYLKRQK